MAQIWKSETSTWIHRNKAREIFLTKAKSFSGKFLEIGPGYGRVMLEIGKVNPITGLEMDEELIELLKKKQLMVVKGLAEKMPFRNESFDVVLCEEVIEHIKNQQSVIIEVHRVLKHGGIAIFTTPNKYIYRILMFLNNLKKMEFNGSIFKNPTPGHISELTTGAFKNLFKKDFSIAEFVPINGYMDNKTINRFSFLAINNLIVAKKR